MVTLTTEQIKELETYLMEIPAKFANPILGYLSKIAQDQKPKEAKVVDLKED
jgi:hypothetical protein